MSGTEDASSSGGGDVGGSGGSKAPPGQLPDCRRMYWRSASWSSSRSTLENLGVDVDKDGVDPRGCNGRPSRLLPTPLTPRSQNKSRSCLPPLQPLAITRRSLDEWPKAGSDDIGEWPIPITPGGRDLNKGGERLKLDLSTIQRSSDKNGGLVKREKIALFDKECSKVAEHIYLGGDAVAKDRDILKRNGITHILNCVGFVCAEYFKSDFVYRTLWLQDSPSEDITSILYDVFDYFEDVREKAGRVFVHCCQGVSRSTSLVIAYLMWREGHSFDDAFQYVKAARGIADPNMGFACQLLQCQKRVHAFPLSPSSLLRMYRIAPHSPYDPLHLVPKMLSDPSRSALDSRGAFILHIPSSIYVWIGKKCEAIMERDARGAVCQIVRYEKVQGPIIVVNEGEEPPYFWDAFSNLLPLMDKLNNGVGIVESSSKVLTGERKVTSYDIDFEIFQKAISGGFVPPISSCGNEQETHLPERESSWSALRRKFASGSMKEFVLVPKLAFSRVHPETMSKAGASSSGTRSSHSVPNLLSSSSSPPYLSPDSISSDSSSSPNFFSDSSSPSPSRVPDSLSLSSTLSSFSSMALLPSKISSQSITKTSEFIDVNFTTGLRSQLRPSPCKRSPLSIAERRGSLSKCLSLPMRADESRGKDVPAICLTDLYDCIDANRDSSACEPLEKDELFEMKGKGDPSQVCKLLTSSCQVADAYSSDGKDSLITTSDEPCRNDQLEKRWSGLAELFDSNSCCNSVQKVICHWPSLEKVASFCASDLDPGAAFIFVTPSSGVGKMTDIVLYIWVGKSFSLDKSKIQVGSDGELRDLEGIDWSQVSNDVLERMGLPEDTNIKIIQEDEEPAEFIALLNSL